MKTIIFLSIIVFSLLLAIYANKSSKKIDISNFLVGGRSFGVIILFFLVVGETYSIAAVIGGPAGMYAKGAFYVIWFVGFLLVSYPIAYLIAPKLWEAGKKYNSLTVPDLYKSHYGSRALELTVAVLYLAFLIPWAQMQFSGLLTIFDALGYEVNQIISVIIIGLIAYIYISISGIKAPAYVAILKDFLLFGSILAVGYLAIHKSGGLNSLYTEVRDQGGSISFRNNDEFIFSISTILFQALVIFTVPFWVTSLFTSKSASGVKKSARFMPLYMLMYPFLIATAYYAILKFPDLGEEKSNLTFISVALDVMPDWAIGFVASGVTLTGLTVISVISLAIGGMFTRNIIPNIAEKSQKSITRIIVICYLIISMILTIGFPTLMLNLMNTSYYGFGQMAPGLFCILFISKVKSLSILLGLFFGLLSVFVMYFGKIDTYQINIGLIALIINISIVTLSHLLSGNKLKHIS